MGFWGQRNTGGRRNGGPHSPLVVWLIWGSFAASSLVYLIPIQLMGAKTGATEPPAIVMSLFSLPVQIGVGVLGLAVAQRARGKSGKAALGALLVGMSISEEAAIFGLIAFLLSGEAGFGYNAIAVTLAAHLLTAPVAAHVANSFRKEAP